jgi:integrase
MAIFTLATGPRAANVTGLTWEQVDLPRKLAWIHPDQAKARKAIAVPLNDTALQAHPLCELATFHLDLTASVKPMRHN